MGLYDTPLPPRDDTNDQEDDSLLLRNVVPLFDVQPDGTDANGFLPPLDTADCTTPPNSEKSNKNVQLLVEKTKCRDDDAAWALQACQGDLVRAWEYISMAERALRKEQTKRQSRQTNNDDEEDENWDEDLFSMMGKIEEEKESAEPSLEEQRKPMSLEDLLDGSEPDQRWLPGKPNPNPVDDEPWFTG